jgi:hypothetical protein
MFLSPECRRVERSNDDKQQVFLDPYRVYIDYADSDLSHDEITYDDVTLDGIRRRAKGAGRACRVTSPFHYAHACGEEEAALRDSPHAAQRFAPRTLNNAHACLEQMMQGD